MKIEYDRTTRRHLLANLQIHCGDCFEVQLAGRWIPVRYEASWLGDGLPTAFLVFDVGSFGELSLQFPTLKSFPARWNKD